jgi:hypothetical protein
MKNSMDQERRQFDVGRMAKGLGLAQGCRQGDHHVTQQVRLRTSSFAHSEGQHIRNLAALAVLCIQPSDSSVPYQFDTDFSPCIAHCLKNLPSQLCQ